MMTTGMYQMQVGKLAYFPPESEVIDIQTQGVLCQSGDTEKFTRGQSYDDSAFDS